MTISFKGYMKERIQRNPVTISADTTFVEARKLIHDKGIRHLPVMDKKNRLVGIVTERDIRGAAPSDATTLSVYELDSLLKELKVSSFMTPKEKLVTITSDTLIEEAVQLMSDHKIGCLPVFEGDKLYGLFTETDALKHFAEIFGLKQKGTRLTLAIDDNPDAISGVFEIIKKHKAGVISIVSPSFNVDKERILAIRLRTEQYEPIVSDLEKGGYQVLSIGKWPSI